MQKLNFYGIIRILVLLYPRWNFSQGRIRMSPLSESTLSTLAAPPGDAKAQEAYKQVKDALDSYTNISHRRVDTYLQGSYRNRTHIKADSDVDVVAELQSTFYYNVDKLSYQEKSQFEIDYPDSGAYGFELFKEDIRAAMILTFGAGNVSEGNKCIKIAGNSQRSDADVLACLEYRKYVRYTRDRKLIIPGIRFKTRDMQWIINWPKEHFKNGVDKNDRTDNKFKGLVRIFKHLRNIIIDQYPEYENFAPSYFLECLLYNVTDSFYSNTFVQSLNGAISFLRGTSLTNFISVNEQDALFQPKNGWNEDDAKTLIMFISAVI